LTLLVGHQEEHLVCKKLSGMVICLELGANDFHIVQLMSLPPHHLFQIGLTFLVLAYPEFPVKEAV